MFSEHFIKYMMNTLNSDKFDKILYTGNILKDTCEILDECLVNILSNT